MNKSPERSNQPEDSETKPMLSPATVVARLRELQAQIPDIAPLTPEERKVLTRARSAATTAGMTTTILLMSHSDLAQQAVGQTPNEVRQWVNDSIDWVAVERELRVVLRGVSDANLVRFRRASQITARVYNICQQLARDPAHAELRPFLQEILREREIARRKKSRRTPDPEVDPESK